MLPLTTYTRYSIQQLTAFFTHVFNFDTCFIGSINKDGLFVGIFQRGFGSGADQRSAPGGDTGIGGNLIAQNDRSSLIGCCSICGYSAIDNNGLVAFIVCWKPGGVVPLGKALSECNFDFLAETKKVWYDDTELICPYCKGRCLCDAEVYYKLLNVETNNEA